MSGIVYTETPSHSDSEKTLCDGIDAIQELCPKTVTKPRQGGSALKHLTSEEQLDNCKLAPLPVLLFLSNLENSHPVFVHWPQ